jgi:hypothetical protein
MSDDLLSKFRQAPRPEFSQALYTKLTQDEKEGSLVSRYFTAKRIALALAALCLMFFLTIALSPTIRAAALAAADSIIAKIIVKGTTVLVNSDEPPTPSEESSESYSEIWTPISPNDVSTNYSFFAKLPSRVPSGYVLQDRVALYYGDMYAKTPDAALFEWKDNTGKTIQLQVMKGSCPNGPGPSSVPASDCTLATYVFVGLKSEPQVIAVKGKSAIFYTGITGLADLSGSVRKWNPSRWKENKDVTKGATMIWESDDRTFFLTASSATITKADLVSMAESIP